MNSRQKELLQFSIEKEKRILAKLKKTYQDSLKEVEEKIKILQLSDLTQSKIYQLEYQRALKGQISTIIERLEDKQYQTINDYLKDKYTDGFVGTLYDLHGQGVPVIFPIDEEQVVKAIIVDTKLSQGLYKRLNKDTTLLKRQIQAEISRGISTNISYGNISRNLKNRSDIPLNNAYRIARTEGHRISEEASRNARIKAKEKGADVLKQWDSTGDKRTRRNHIELDGQIREIEEKFEIAGHSASEPGHFGIASEDINCRCVSLTRVKWALDEEELEKLKEKAEYFELDKTKDFEDFKGKYFRAVEKENSHKDLDKNLMINKKIIYSNSYHRRINLIDTDLKLTKIIKDIAIEILEHRNGTTFEDLVFIDTNTYEKLVSNSQNIERAVSPTKKMRKLIAKSDEETIVAIHNHPGSTLPSIDDIKVSFYRKYKYGIIICHNGNIYKYRVLRKVDDILYSICIDKYYKDKYTINELIIELEKLGIYLEVL